MTRQLSVRDSYCFGTPNVIQFHQLFSLSIEECWLLHSELVKTWSYRRVLRNWLWHLNRVVNSWPVTCLVNSPAEAPNKPSVFAIRAPALLVSLWVLSPSELQLSSCLSESWLHQSSSSPRVSESCLHCFRSFTHNSDYMGTAERTVWWKTFTIIDSVFQPAAVWNLSRTCTVCNYVCVCLMKVVPMLRWNHRSKPPSCWCVVTEGANSLSCCRASFTNLPHSNTHAFKVIPRSVLLKAQSL